MTTDSTRPDRDVPNADLLGLSKEDLERQKLAAEIRDLRRPLWKNLTNWVAGITVVLSISAAIFQFQQSRIGDAQAKLDKSHAEFDAARAKADLAAAQIAEANVQQQTATLTAQRDNLQLQINNLKPQLAAAQSQLNDAKKQIETSKNLLASAQRTATPDVSRAITAQNLENERFLKLHLFHEPPPPAP